MTRSYIYFTMNLYLILYFVHDSTCQDYDEYDNTIGLEKTYISRVERVLKGLMIPLRIVDGAASEIQSGVNTILSKLPGPFKNIPNGRASRGFGEVLNLFKDKFKAVYPGTHWCGAGDIAENENDLGLFQRTDACCRDHDSCRGGIPAEEQRNGLLNNGIFTRSPCWCDEAFYQCLKNANSIVSTKIGITYFNILRPQCFKVDYPVIGCNKYGRSRLIDNKCLEYNFDYNQRPKEQWFDNPDFI